MRLSVALLVLCLSVPAVAGPPPIEQPVVVPRVAAVVRPFRAYADPTVPAAATGLRDLSFPEVARVVEGILDDPRFARVDFVERALDTERDAAQQDIVFIAQQSARLGGEHRRAFNLASAVSELEAALATYERTTRAWTHPAEVGDVLLDLALVQLELAAASDEAVHEARAQDALRSLIRVDPGRVLDRSVYPSRVVEAWEQAYLSHFVDGGRSIRLSAHEAESLADLVDVDQLVWLFTMTDASRTVVVVQVYDRIAGRFELDEAFAAAPTNDAVGDGVHRRISAATACQALVLPPEVTPEETEEGAVYVDLSYSSGTYVDRPTERLFYNRGVRVSVSWMLRETFGLYLAGQQWNAQRDPNGELLASLDTSRLVIGALAGGRVGRLRVYGVGGLDVARVGRIRATDDFWCKVSEGEPFVFDAERRCDPEDVTDIRPQGQFGIAMGLGLDVRVVGPFWLHGMATSTVTVTPFENRALGAPIGVDVGASYRF